jgi:cell fate regulator YaaT (PSP1 superfamily)
MERVICVRLRDTGQSFHYLAGEISLKEGDYVIVEHDRGLDYGQVVCMGSGGVEIKDRDARDKELEDSEPKEKDFKEAGEKQLVKKIVRLAKEGDLKQIEENRAKSKEAFNTCIKKSGEHKLEMKLVQAEYSFDRSKIVFYYTSGGRVDFRELVKDLAKIFKARIEMRHIGVRDETKFFGGYGPCGRELCCSRFLTDFVPVTIKMAKEQGLPLNPPKISGICGRLMCCLSYECGAYKQLSKGLPREGEKISVKDVKGKVIGVNVFKRSVTVELENGTITEIKYKL